MHYHVPANKRIEFDIFLRLFPKVYERAGQTLDATQYTIKILDPIMKELEKAGIVENIAKPVKTTKK